MPTNILMPALSPTMTEGTLARWVKKEGDDVKAGDVIAEIETDKATMEVEAVDEGKLGKILVPEGTAGVAVNAPIAVLLEDGEDVGTIKAEAAKSPSPETPRGVSTSPKGEVKDAGSHGAFSAPLPKGEVKPPLGDLGKSKRTFASPLARRMAEQMGIDLSSIQGSGPHGRIVKDDLVVSRESGVVSQKATQKLTANDSRLTTAKQLADAYGMKYKEIPNNSIRKVIARRLVESKQTVPHFYLTIECRIDNLLAARAEINDKADGKFKLSVNDFVIKAAANALKAYPAANTAWTDEAILQFEHADISVAVSTPNGLITPIVKAAETKGLKQISEEIKDLAKRARDGKLKPEEFQGGTFCVSNLGMYGVQEFGAIINPPQSCILAVGAGEQKPYVDKGEIGIGTFMKCTLSVDHRSVDGSVGAEYLQILKQYIENPISMIL